MTGRDTKSKTSKTKLKQKVFSSNKILSDKYKLDYVLTYEGHKGKTADITF